MKTRYVIGSLDQPLFLIVHCSHEEAKQVCYYSTTDDEALATRYDGFSVAGLVLAILSNQYDAIGALNLMPLPIKDGCVDHQYTLPL